MNRELNIFGDRSVGRAALGRATGYSLKCTPLTPRSLRAVSEARRLSKVAK
jgi:hypothetical protein